MTIEECCACGWLVDYAMCGCPGGRPMGPFVPATACPRCERYSCICNDTTATPPPRDQPAESDGSREAIIPANPPSAGGGGPKP